MKTKIQSAFLGLAIGDALGVPVEFLEREELKLNPVTKMMGHGTHHQPLGTFSDDASMTFCTAESLIKGYDLVDMSAKFLAWRDQAYWIAGNVVFDVGGTTDFVLDKLRQNNDPYHLGESDEFSNGNGSLMRMLPLAFYVKEMEAIERFNTIKEVSAITHAHIRSIIGCFYYTEFIRVLLLGYEKEFAYQFLKDTFKNALIQLGIDSAELKLYDRLLEEDIVTLAEEDISSSGYIVDSLEASIWCILKTDNFRDAVLKAVNLGDDTDTIGAITGSIAGILYPNDIPEEWINQLARNTDIIDLANRFSESIK